MAVTGYTTGELAALGRAVDPATPPRTARAIDRRLADWDEPVDEDPGWYRSPFWADPLHDARDERRTEGERQRADAEPLTAREVV